jgi:hypothetical protein
MTSLLLLAPAGRIIDFVESGKLLLGAVKYVVLDEADRLLDTGNQDAILKLYQRFPKAGTGISRLQVHGPATPFGHGHSSLSSTSLVAPRPGDLLYELLSRQSLSQQQHCGDLFPSPT